MGLPTKPKSWAIHLSKILKVFQEIHGLARFPVDVSSIAQEYSRQVFPNEPITLVKGLDTSENFEGMLLPSPNKDGEWAILYNQAIKSRGRQNFTLAHELGHYLLHRSLSPEGIKCTSRDMLDWKSDHGRIEAEANTFASYLLMPLDDFRYHTEQGKIGMELMRHLSDRYDVSVSAAILKWLSYTNKRAMIVVGKDGYIDWAWSSKRLLKSGIFYRARQIVTLLPSESLAYRRNTTIDNVKGITHSKGVWLGDEEVHESVIFSDYNRLSVSLLIYPEDAPPRSNNIKHNY